MVPLSFPKTKFMKYSDTWKGLCSSHPRRMAPQEGARLLSFLEIAHLGTVPLVKGHDVLRLNQRLGSITQEVNIWYEYLWRFSVITPSWKTCISFAKFTFFRWWLVALCTYNRETQVLSGHFINDFSYLSNVALSQLQGRTSVGIIFSKFHPTWFFLQSLARNLGELWVI